MFTFVRHYLLSLQFFTRIPVTGRLAAWVGYSPAMLRASAGHFPGVGVLVGALVAVCTALPQLCHRDHFRRWWPLCWARCSV